MQILERLAIGVVFVVSGVCCAPLGGQMPNSSEKTSAVSDDKKQIEEKANHKGKFTIGKETTYVEGPLDKDGYIDYAAALNRLLSKDVTAANNANVLIWQALGPRPEGGALFPEIFDLLGMKAPPEKGEYFIGLHRFKRDQLKIEPGESFDEIESQRSVVVRRPWTAKEFPHLASWLNSNDKPLKVIAAATRRTHYFSPIVFHPATPKPASLVSCLLPGVNKCREVAGALVARATLHAVDQPDDAWQDLIVCHRLGRLIGRGGTIIECLVGKAIDEMACRADLVFLQCAKPNGSRLEKCLGDLRQLAPFDLSAKVALDQRFVVLETAMLIDREGFNELDKAKAPAGAYRVFEEMDWDPILRSVNKWHDRLSTAMREKDRAKREAKLDAMVAELEERTKSLKVDKQLEPADTRRLARAREHAIIGTTIALMAPIIRKTQQNFDRLDQRHDNLRVAFALAWHQADHRQFPKELSALAPKYLKEVPLDRFTNKPLIYRRTEKGYLLFSVGITSKNEKQRPDDSPPDEELAIRFPQK